MGKINSFTLIEILVSLFLIGVLLIVSIKSINYISNINQLNELNYLALNRAESEMNRLVMFYKEYDIDTSISTYSKTFPHLIENRYYEDNKSEINGTNETGLLIENSKNLVEIKNLNTYNVILDNDIVGVLNWITDGNRSDINISLNITYPYRYKNSQIEPIWDFTQTINLKTSVSK